MVTDRGLEVLRAIVQDYVSSKEPVGSKAIVERHHFGVSAATIRNDMAQLEEEELIAAPHTSSGRIPTDKGYRVFVDQLADRRPLSGVQRQAIETFLAQSIDLDDVLGRTVRLLAQLTNQVALVQYPSFSRASVQHVEIVRVSESKLLVVLITDTGRVEQRVVDADALIEDSEIEPLKLSVNKRVVGKTVERAAAELQADAAEDASTLSKLVDAAVVDQLWHYRQEKLVMAGAANLARTEEDFSGSIFPVLEALEQQVVLLRLFGEMEADHLGVSASIGRENAAFGLGETSVVTSHYRSSPGEIARIGVLGPTRMDYVGNMAAVRAVARYLSRLLNTD